MKERTQSMHWLRWHHGTVTDSKWRVVAARARHATSRQVTVSDVISVWGVMLECASQASPRGTLVGWNDEDVAALLELDEAVVAAIHLGMQGKTLEGNRLISWEKRQPKREREDPTAADRQKRKRARDAAATGVRGRDNEESHPREEERREEEILSLGNPHPDLAQKLAAAERACLLMESKGCKRSNPLDIDLQAAIEEGILPETLAATALEAINARATNPFAWAVTVARRRHAAGPSTVVPTKSGAQPQTMSPHRPYTAPPPLSPDAAFRVEQAQYAQMLSDGLIDQANHDRMLAEAKDRRARAGPAKTAPPSSSPPTTAQAPA